MTIKPSIYFLYRYYLGDRLLSQGKVWLESAVIEQIGTCFPERFPQQMLSNLSESDELHQEFHLYRLQQLDKSLQDMDEEVGNGNMRSHCTTLLFSDISTERMRLINSLYFRYTCMLLAFSCYEKYLGLGLCLWILICSWVIVDCVLIRWWMSRYRSRKTSARWRCWFYLHVVGLSLLPATWRNPSNISPRNSAVTWMSSLTSIPGVSLRIHAMFSKLIV